MPQTEHRGRFATGCLNCRQRKIKVQRLLPAFYIEANEHSVTRPGHHAIAVSRDDGHVPDTESLQTLRSGTRM
jgi:hypothetical protein